MTNPSSSIETVTIPAGTTADDPVEVQVPRGGELEVRDADGAAWMRLNNRENERRPLRPGETLCWTEEAPVTRVLFDNAEADNPSTVEYEVRHGFTVRGFGGRPQGAQGQPPGPDRLGGDLAPGNTIAPGEEAAEVVDVELSGKVRVRAQVSGTASIQQTATEALAGGQVVALDEGADVLFALALDLTLEEYDVNGDGVLTQTASTDLTTLGSWPAAVDGGGQGLVLFASQDLLVVIAQDTVNADTHAVTLDVSAPGAPTVSGSVQFHNDTRTGTSVAGVEAAGSRVVYTRLRDLHAIDVTTPGAPTDLGAHRPNGNEPRGFGIDDDNDVMVVGTGPGNDPAVSTYDLSSPVASPFNRLATLTLETSRSRATVMAVDPSDELAFVAFEGAGGAGTRVIATVSYGVPANPTEEFRSGEFALDNLDDGCMGRYEEGLEYIALEGDDLFEVWNLQDPADPTLLFSEGFTDSSDHNAVQWSPSQDAIFRSADGQTRRYELDPGSDELHVFPLLSNDDRARTEVPAPVVLRSGEEGLLDLDHVGADRVEVELRGRSSLQATIDYVEIAQE